MGKDEQLITLAVHTETHAMRLKEVLEFHDIPVTLEDIDCKDMLLSGAPKKVRIPFQHIAMGLKILESGEAALEPSALMRMTGMDNILLIPVDFSPLSLLAVKAGFYLAQKLNVEPMLMHCYAGSIIESAINEGSMINYPYDPASETEIENEMVETDELRRQASAQLTALKKQIKGEQSEGRLPDIKFSTSLLPGIPEQVILDYCKSNKPILTLMVTRGANKKGMDLVGSVTAEVIDSCRVPLVTIPESYQPGGIENIKRVAMFCTFSGYDTLVIRWLMRTFDFPAISFFLIPESDRASAGTRRKLDDLREYFNRTYPTADFHASMLKQGKFDDSVRDLLEENDIQLIIVPNRKSSALSRFFRPTLAHKILFEKDIPLVVLPV